MVDGASANAPTSTNEEVSRQEPVVAEKEEEAGFLKNISVRLPHTSAPVKLPPLRPEEPLVSIRTALAELVDCAHITNYQLCLGDRLLDDFGDLSSVTEDSVIDLKLQPYQNVRDQVMRLQQLLQGNPPMVKTLVPSEKEEKDKDDVKKAMSEPQPDLVTSSGKGASKKDISQPETVQPLKDTLLISPQDLNEYYNAVTGLEPDDKVEKLEELEREMHTGTDISFLASPSPRRRLLGDLAHISVKMKGAEDPIFVTATRQGFYVNKSTLTTLDPSPLSTDVHHELLDCLLRASPQFKQRWERALDAAQEKLELTQEDVPLRALYRLAAQNYGSTMDAVIVRPAWLVPFAPDDSLLITKPHAPLPLVADTYGLDWTSGVQRDWNEELQTAREMPTTTANERLERARVINKVLADFGDAAFKAVKAIQEGQILPMNPNEPQRSHVYLHNCIFISRAVDAGVETFKMCQGDAAAKKTASRDAQCVAFLHRLDAPELYTLATVLLDYLGTRYVCQSVVPGILQGEKTHTLMYGTVEASAVMSWNKDMQDRLEQTIGKSAMCATRVQPAQALTDERLAEIAALRTEPPLEISPEQSKNVVKEPTTSVCGPIEGKGIKGSDKRNYVLDLTRLTPRDANWIPKTKGGTGKWEEVYSKNEFIPESLDDPEWVASVLRHELVKSLTQHKMTVYLKTKEVAGDQDKNGNSPDKAENETRSEKAEGEEIAGEDVEPKDDNKDGDLAEKLPKKKSLAPEDEEFLESLRLNVNVFLPNLRSLKGLDDNSVARLEKDEEEAREVAIHLWDVVLPKMTQEMREGEGHQLPLDGKSMVELLHQRGINLRYMGRLATLAVKEEAKDSKAWADIQAGNINSISRRVLPLSWLELLETEMVARAAKHVLDRYLSEEGCQIFQVIASFLSALVSEGEETAGDTEKRLAKMTKDDGFPDDEELAGFSLVGNVPIRGRKDVWDDIEKEIGRRFRYKVHLYNCSKPSGRASYATLLRRLCQRTGVRLAAKKYSLGGKCLCASEGSLINSFPISPLDIVDVVPLMKHAGALAGEGFVPCIGGASIPSLHILFPDAKATFETAHLHFSARNLPHALEYAQEATALYQRVVDGPLHLNVSRCLDLTAAILFEAGENALAAAHASRSLGLAIQLGGFDAAETMAGHSTLSHILLSSQQIQSGVQHLMAVAYLMELLAGPRYVELSNCLYKIGSFYQMTNPELALQYFKMAQACPHPDRLAEGMMSKGAAMLYAKIEQYRSAVDSEKKTYQLYSMLLGEGHELTLNSQKALQTYTKLAVEQGNRKIEQEKLRKEEEAADAIASLIEAEEEEERKKRKSKGKGKKK